MVIWYDGGTIVIQNDGNKEKSHWIRCDIYIINEMIKKEIKIGCTRSVLTNYTFKSWFIFLIHHKHRRLNTKQHVTNISFRYKSQTLCR